MGKTGAYTRTGAGIALLGALLSGCGGPPPLPRTQSPPERTSATVATAAVATVAPEQATSASVEATGVPGGASELLSDCVALSEPLQEVVQVAVTTSEAPLDDVVNGATLPGCRLSASWTGAHLSDFAAVSLQTGALLIERGWEPDERYLADGPTGTVAGFTMGDKLALLQVEWKPAPEVACPIDQPISECDMLPEQRLFELNLDIASTAQ